MEITATQSNSATSTTGQTPAPKTVDQLANKETFLQLLVAQIRNQDPLNPADGIEFLSQLAQFSQLEQLIGIRSALNGLTTEVTPETPPATKDVTPAN